MSERCRAPDPESTNVCCLEKGHEGWHCNSQEGITWSDDHVAPEATVTMTEDATPELKEALGTMVAAATEALPADPDLPVTVAGRQTLMCDRDHIWKAHQGVDCPVCTEMDTSVKEADGCEASVPEYETVEYWKERYLEVRREQGQDEGLREALEKIAALHVKTDRVFGRFTEPVSVKIARAALSQGGG